MTTIKRKGESEIDRNLVNEIQWLDELGQCYNYPARRKLHARLALLNTEEILSLLLFEVHRLHGRVLYGKIKYLQGSAACKQSYAEEQVRYQKQVRAEERKAAKEAMDKEAKVSKQIGDLRASKGKVIDEARKLAAESGRPDTCRLSPDELRLYEEAVRSTE